MISLENPLLREWDGPFGGVPAFDRVRLSDVEEAVERAMALHLEEIDAVVSKPEGPTFVNTIVELEKTGRALHRVMVFYGVWSSNLSSPEFRALEGRVAPRLAEHDSKILQNTHLFDRIRAVHDGAEYGRLTSAEKRLTWLVYARFTRHGATLDAEGRARYAAIDQRLAVLQTEFANNVLADEENQVTYLGPGQLSGLPDGFIEAAARAARDRGREGEYAVLNTRSAIDPFLTYSDERELREEVWRTFYKRGDNNDEHDNKAIITRILELRHERVQLLGYSTYADWRLEDRMAGTPERALELLDAVWPSAVARVAEEVADMQRVADGEGLGDKIEPWDYRYYAEKVRASRYDLDSNEVRQYFELDRLREAMFFVAGRLFGFEFVEIADGSIPVFHSDVRVWEVRDLETRSHVGLWYLDPFARPGKESGAWAAAFRSHERFDGKRTVLASNNSNFIQAAPGAPVLMSFDDARTLFHEFGHALHYLSSSVKYPSLNGAVRDFIEFQSQLLERWLLTGEVIERFMIHERTGQPMPSELVGKIRRAARFNQGFQTTEYLACALMDLRYHRVDPAGLDPAAFEIETLEELGMPRELPMRHRSPHFLHIFSSEGYAAGYYGYMWADVLTADAAEAFAEAPGGFFDPDVARRLVGNLFSPQNSIDPAEAYRAFRGRDAGIGALMRDRGFPLA